MNPSATASATVARLLVAGHLKIAAWFWSTIAVVAVGVAAVLSLVDAIAGSLWLAVTASGAKYFLMVIGITLTTIHLRPYVAHGVTRRQFARGALIFVAAMTAGFAVVSLLGFAVERPLYDALGLLDGLDEPYPVSSAREAAVHLGRTAPIYLAHMASGWLIGTLYYRFGGRTGTALIPVAFLPALLSEIVFGSEWTGAGAVLALDRAPVPYPVGVVVAATAAALALAAAYRLVRDVPVLSAPAGARR